MAEKPHILQQKRAYQWRHQLLRRWRRRIQHRWRPPTTLLKRRKQRDRLTQLPDSIIFHILSFLPTFDVVYRVAFVTKEWFSLIRTSFPTLVFRRSELLNSSVNNQKFILYVDEVMKYHNPENFEKCCFEFKYAWFERDNRYHKEKMDGWIRLAIHRKVKELQLLFDDEYTYNYYHVPNFLFRNEVLTRLSIRRATFDDYNRGINWKSSLKFLSIERTNLDDVTLKRIIVGCPLLEYLKLGYCKNINRLEIVSSNLKNLVLHNCEYASASDKRRHGEMLHISAPSLRELIVDGYMRYNKCIVDTCSVETATLDFQKDLNQDKDRQRDSDSESESESESDSDSDDNGNEYEEENMVVHNIIGTEEIRNTKPMKILTCIRHVKKLTLGNWVFQVLVSEYKPFLFSSNCKSLSLDISIKQWELPGLATMLQFCPELESLTINMPVTVHRLKGNDVNGDEDEEKNFWEINPIYKNCNCLISHLKKLNIVGLVRCKGSKQVIEFLQFILQNAKVLERLSVKVDKKIDYQYNRENSNKKDKDFHQLCMFYTLSSLPKSSPVAVIQVFSNDTNQTT